MHCVRSGPNGAAKLCLRPPLWSMWGVSDLNPALLPFALVVFFVSMVTLCAHTTAWMSAPAGFSLMIVLGVAAAAGVMLLLPRFRSGVANADAALEGRVGFALVLLAWGPLMAFHLQNIPGLSALRIHLNPGALRPGLRAEDFGALAVVQILAVALATLLSGIALWRIRVAHRPPQVSWGWRALLASCLLYATIALTLIFYRELHL